MPSKKRDVREVKGWGDLANDRQLDGVAGQIITRKQQYYSHGGFDWYRKRVTNLNAVVNQEIPANKRNTRMGIVRAMTRSSYDYYLNRCTDLFDVPQLVQVMAEVSNDKNKKLADELTIYANAVLNSKNKWYKRHLIERFKYLPDYGWSPASDYYKINNGWAVKAVTTNTGLPGLERMVFDAESDPYQSGATSRIVRPFDWFGDVFHSMNEQNFQGEIRRLYAKDIDNCIAMKNAEGKPVYNKEILVKYKQQINEGHKFPDSSRYQAAENGQQSMGSKESWNSPGFVDCICYYGTCDMAGLDNNDSNDYYVEVLATGDVIRFQEVPLDRRTMYTHMQTHPLRDNPFSRSWLDLMYDQQIMADIVSNGMMEMVYDGMHKFWVYDETSLANPEDFENPPGFNVLLRQVGANMPQLINPQSNSGIRDAMELLSFMSREQEAHGVSLQQLGTVGQSTAKTATQSRITSSADALKYRAPIKLCMANAVIPQITNLVMLSMVNDPDEVKALYSSDGEKVQITPEHVNFFLHGSQITMYDTITRDYDDLSARMNSFLQMAQGLTQLKDPAPYIKALRQSGRYGGIPQDVIDDMLPKPEPIDADAEAQGQAQQVQDQAGQEMQAQMQAMQQQLQEATQQIEQLKGKYEIEAAKLQLESRRVDLEAEKIGIERTKVESNIQLKTVDTVSRASSIPKQEFRTGEKDSLYNAFEQE